MKLADDTAGHGGRYGFVRTLGWNDEAVYFVITVCALFNFYKRWIDAGGVQALSDEAHWQGAKNHRRTGIRPQLYGRSTKEGSVLT